MLLCGFNHLIFFRKYGPCSDDWKILCPAGYGIVNAEDKECKDSDVSDRGENCNKRSEECNICQSKVKDSEYEVKCNLKNQKSKALIYVVTSIRRILCAENRYKNENSEIGKERNYFILFDIFGSLLICVVLCICYLFEFVFG